MKNPIIPKTVKFLVLFVFLLPGIWNRIQVFAQQPPVTNFTPPPATLNRFQQGIVPQLIGLEYNPDQIAALLDRYGFQFGEGIPVPNNDSIGRITFQSQTAGIQGNPDEPITVHFAVEIPMYEIPDFRRMFYEDAIQQIERGSFSVGDVVGIPSDLPQGIIVRQTPPPFTVHEIGTPINLFYSQGTVPSLLRLTVEQAEQKVQPLEWRLQIIEKAIRTETAGIIVDQQPRAGEPIPRNRIINVTVSVSEPQANNGNGDFPLWILWTGSLLAAIGLGGFLGKKIGNKRKKTGGKNELKLNLNPVLDAGKQQIESSENSLIESYLQIKFINDFGEQTIKNN